MKVITIAGMIGAGKSSLTKYISDRYNSTAKYEDVEHPPVKQWLEKWYTNTEKEREEQRVPIFTQMAFLISRMNSLRDCMLDERQGFAVLDRSIYEDKLFARLKYDIGEITQDEWDLYCQLLDTMWKEIDMIPQKAPHLTIYVRASFETVMSRIWKRGRDYETTEMDDSMKEWYKTLHEAYDDYMFNEYNYSEVLVIDGDKYDFVENEADREEVLKIIDDKLKELGVVAKEKEQDFPQWAVGKECLIKAEWFKEFYGKVGIVQEVFTSHHGEFIVNVKVEGRDTQITLYGESQYQILN